MIWKAKTQKRNWKGYEWRGLGELTLEDFSGNKMPALFFDGGTIFSTKIRLKSGIKRFAIWNTRDDTTEEWKNGTPRAPCWKIWGHLLGFYKGLCSSLNFHFIFIFINTKRGSRIFSPPPTFIFLFIFTKVHVKSEIWMNPENKTEKHQYEKTSGSLV